LIQRHIVPDFGSLPNHYPHAVIDKDTPPDPRPGMDLNPGQESRDVTDEARKGGQLTLPQPMRHAVKQ
jgi:hypothetical protein